jgi:hypothetical protein
MKRMRSVPAARQFDQFLARYTPEIARLAKAIRRKMRTIVPGAIELVYDNYNALVIGFGPTERAGDALFSVALYPRWVTLFFLRGATLPDPHRVMQGSGKVVRQVRLASPADLDRPVLRDLMDAELARSDIPFGAKPRLMIKSISPAQRPRRAGDRPLKKAERLDVHRRSTTGDANCDQRTLENNLHVHDLARGRDDVDFRRLQNER